MSTDNKHDPFAPPPGTQVHVYDGIEEHDNFLPRWWLWLLYGSMVFSAGYYAHYTFGPGPTLRDEYVTAMQQLESVQAANAPKPGQPGGDTEESLKAWAASDAHQKQGKDAYVAKCAVCHGQKGEGGIGPNLADDYWIHGAKHVEIAKTIANGITDKGMPPWGALVSPDELKSLVAYVRALHGTNPPNAKGAQGEKVVME
jgi:cytochrome c oxidase cbb3-type subunit 3